TSTTSVASSW
nr:Chain C, Decapeptide: THR-SER-THR-THR-SER-VAL-ALA-SER-SER-TRP [synthetic construct]